MALPFALKSLRAELNRTRTWNIRFCIQGAQFGWQLLLCIEEDVALWR